MSEGNSGKCLFHLLLNPEFPEYLVEWKAPHVTFARLGLLAVSEEAEIWQAVTAKSPSSFESWSNRLLILASYKSSMVRLEKEWANLVKRWLSLVWEAPVLASEFSISC